MTSATKRTTRATKSRSNSRSTSRGLDTDTVVAAALVVAREQGIAAVSMRVVADRLGVTPMALYHYVQTKDQLVKLVADAVILQVELPRSTPDWRSGFLTAMADYRQKVAEYPGLAAVLLHGGLLPNARRLVNGQLEMLREAGFSPAEARSTYAAFHLLILGRLTVDEARRTRSARGPVHERDPEIDAYLSDLQGEASFDLAAKVLLDGLESRRQTSKRPARSVKRRTK